jgi:hypothetical protein
LNLAGKFHGLTTVANQVHSVTGGLKNSLNQLLIDFIILGYQNTQIVLTAFSCIEFRHRFSIPWNFKHSAAEGDAEPFTDSDRQAILFAVYCIGPLAKKLNARSGPGNNLLIWGDEGKAAMKRGL